MSERTDRAERNKDPLQVYAEADEQTRAVIEKELDRIDALDRRDVQLNSLGLTYGVVVTLAFLAACVYLVATGHGVEGTVLASSSSAAWSRSWRWVAVADQAYATAIASIETSRPRGSLTLAGADRAGAGSGMCRA